MIDIRKREIWTGKWRWNTTSANYTDPLHTKTGKYHEIVVKDNHMMMFTTETYRNGDSRSWRWEGLFDGVPRPILWEDDKAPMMQIAFTFVDELVGGDIYKSPDGQVHGAEYLILGPDNYKVWGCKTIDNVQFPYFEEWDRID